MRRMCIAACRSRAGVDEDQQACEFRGIGTDWTTTPLLGHRRYIATRRSPRRKATIRSTCWPRRSSRRARRTARRSRPRSKTWGHPWKAWWWTYDKPFSKTNHEAIGANIPVFGEVRGGKGVYACPEDRKKASIAQIDN